MGLKGECYELDSEEDSSSLFFSPSPNVHTFLNHHLDGVLGKTCILVDATSIELMRFLCKRWLLSRCCSWNLKLGSPRMEINGKWFSSPAERNKSG